MKTFRDSFHELQSVKSLTVTSLLLALSVALGFYQVQLTDFIRISFSYLPHELASMFFGPVVGGIFGGAMDILKYLVNPTGAFFPGFTISAIVNGLIYGVVLYKKPLHPVRVLAANGLSSLIVSLGLNTYWLTILYGNGFMAILPARVTQQLIMFPITSVLFFLVAKVLLKANVMELVRGKSAS